MTTINRDRVNKITSQRIDSKWSQNEVSEKQQIDTGEELSKNGGIQIDVLIKVDELI